jgi:hypothetical protein
LGDAGGSTYQATPLGTEEGRSENEAGFGTGTSAGNGGDDLYRLCLDLCSEETDLDYCIDVVCADLARSNGGDVPYVEPPTPGGDYCADLTDEEREAFDSLPPACESCICTTPPQTVEAECSTACGL